MPHLTPEELDAMISSWHEGKGSNLELHEYLGWKWVEYKRWVETGRMPDV